MNTCTFYSISFSFFNHIFAFVLINFFVLFICIPLIKQVTVARFHFLKFKKKNNTYYMLCITQLLNRKLIQIKIKKYGAKLAKSINSVGK